MQRWADQLSPVVVVGQVCSLAVCRDVDAGAPAVAVNRAAVVQLHRIPVDAVHLPQPAHVVVARPLAQVVAAMRLLAVA